MKTRLLLSIGFICTAVLLHAQINEIDVPTKLNNIEQNNEIDELIGLDDNGIMTTRNIQSLNIPDLKVVDNHIHVVIDGDTYKLPLNQEQSKEQQLFVNSFQLNGKTLELGFSNGEKFEVDLSHLIQYQRAATGAFMTTANVTSNSPGSLNVDDFVFGSSSLDFTNSAEGLRVLFDKDKGAFRAGQTTGMEWDDANRGTRSTAFGLDNTASGKNAFATGKGNTASEDAAVAFGSNNMATGKKTFLTGANNVASGANSFALGSNSTVSGKGSGSLGDVNSVSGDYANAVGMGLLAESAAQFSTGTYNSAALVFNSTDPTIATDRLFVIGNGTSSATRSDAYVMLKNGNSTQNGNATINGNQTINGTVTVDGDGSGGGQAYNLPAQDGTINQVMQTNGSGQANWATLNVNDADASPMNELQTISAGGSTSPSIILSNSGGTITFEPGSNVTFSRSGNTITVNAAGGGGGSSCAAFGDGSAGNTTIAASTDWSATPPANGNFQFDNLTINGGVTLTVPSGTIIRTSGNFVNNGTIVVKEGLPNSRWSGHADDGFPQVKGLTKDERRALDKETLRHLNYLGPIGGANGDDGGNTGITAMGGTGGGTLTIISGGTLTNNGTINALGGNANDETAGSDISGSSGGGGGMLLLVADGNITGGTISVRGGEGGNPGGADDDHAGGGGGGGLIHFVSPNANAVTGTFNVSGGNPGADSAANTGSRGGHGGASAGDGGQGADSSTSHGYQAPQAGGAGQVLRSQMSSTCGFFN